MLQIPSHLPLLELCGKFISINESCFCFQVQVTPAHPMSSPAETAFVLMRHTCVIDKMTVTMLSMSRIAVSEYLTLSIPNTTTGMNIIFLNCADK